MKALPEGNILIIDDDKDDHCFFTNALEGLQSSGITEGRIINITSVYDGVEGIDFLLKRGSYKNSTAPPHDLIVLDINMPLVNGYDILREIKEQPKLKNIPVYILTSTDPESSKKCLTLGCVGFFSKPPNIGELRVVVLEMIKRFRHL